MTLMKRLRRRGEQQRKQKLLLKLNLSKHRLLFSPSLHRHPFNRSSNQLSLPSHLSTRFLTFFQVCPRRVYNLFSHKCQDLASFSLLPSHKLSLAFHNLVCKRHPRLALASCSKLNLRVVALGFCNLQYSNIPDSDR